MLMEFIAKAKSYYLIITHGLEQQNAIKIKACVKCALSLLKYTNKYEHLQQFYDFINHLSPVLQTLYHIIHCVRLIQSVVFNDRFTCIERS